MNNNRPLERKPIRVPTGYQDGDTMVDGYQTLHPTHPKYEENFERAASAYRRFGVPMPYHDESLLGPAGHESSPSHPGGAMTLGGALSEETPYARARAILASGPTLDAAFADLLTQPIAENVDDETWRQLELLGYRRDLKGAGLTGQSVSVSVSVSGEEVRISGWNG